MEISNKSTESHVTLVSLPKINFVITSNFFPKPKPNIKENNKPLEGRKRNFSELMRLSPEEKDEEKKKREERFGEWFENVKKIAVSVKPTFHFDASELETANLTDVYSQNWLLFFEHIIQSFENLEKIESSIKEFKMKEIELPYDNIQKIIEKHKEKLPSNKGSNVVMRTYKTLTKINENRDDNNSKKEEFKQPDLSIPSTYSNKISERNSFPNPSFTIPHTPPSQPPPQEVNKLPLTTPQSSFLSKEVPEMKKPESKPNSMKKETVPQQPPTENPSIFNLFKTDNNSTTKPASLKKTPLLENDENPSIFEIFKVPKDSKIIENNEKSIEKEVPLKESKKKDTNHLNTSIVINRPLDQRTVSEQIPQNNTDFNTNYHQNQGNLLGNFLGQMDESKANPFFGGIHTNTIQPEYNNNVNSGALEIMNLFNRKPENEILKPQNNHQILQNPPTIQSNPFFQGNPLFQQQPSQPQPSFNLFPPQSQALPSNIFQKPGNSYQNPPFDAYPNQNAHLFTNPLQNPTYPQNFQGLSHNQTGFQPQPTQNLLNNGYFQQENPHSFMQNNEKNPLFIENYTVQNENFGQQIAPMHLEMDSGRHHHMQNMQFSMENENRMGMNSNINLRPNENFQNPLDLSFGQKGNSGMNIFGNGNSVNLFAKGNEGKNENPGFNSNLPSTITNLFQNSQSNTNTDNAVFDNRKVDPTEMRMKNRDEKQKKYTLRVNN